MDESIYNSCNVVSGYRKGDIQNIAATVIKGRLIANVSSVSREPYIAWSIYQTIDGVYIVNEQIIHAYDEYAYSIRIFLSKAELMANLPEISDRAMLLLA